MKIKKNGNVIDVTKGAFESLFRGYGWKETGDVERSNNKNGVNFMNPHSTNDVRQEMAPDELPFGNIMNENVTEQSVNENFGSYEIVYEDMTIKQLKEYADEKSIPLDGVTAKADIISVIRNAEV